jgi:hypothetical protein
MVINRWTSYVVNKGADPFGLGRQTYITLRGKRNKKLTVVTGYRVVFQFVKNLQVWLEHLVMRHKIILSIDSNEDLYCTTGTYTNLTYYPTIVTVNRGKTRLDYTLVSSTLALAVLRSGMYPFTHYF